MLWGQGIKVYTDHKNLTRDALGLTSDRVYCWRLLLEEYAPEIIYRLVWAEPKTIASSAILDL